MTPQNVRPEFIVAVKEFKDYLNSKRFMVIFGVLALLTIIGAITGYISYSDSLTTYNSQLSSTNSTMSFMRGPGIVSMPSVLNIFSSYGTYIASVGAFLAICMGFDMITREKEEGTLKLLLTHPVFRDSVINGKLLGAGSMLVMVLASTFLATVAVMMFFGVVPATDDLTRIVAFFGATLLFMFTFLAISVTASTISGNSSMAVLIAIFVLIIGAVMPDISTTVSEAIMGSEPSMMIPSTSTDGSTDNFGGGSGSGSTITMTVVGVGSAQSVQGGPDFRGNGTRMTINPEYTSYWGTRNAIQNTLNIISPTYNYQVISQVINDKLSSPRASSANQGFFVRSSEQTVSLLESLSSVWMNIMALLVMIIVGFGISYVRFIRVDIR